MTMPQINPEDLDKLEDTPLPMTVEHSIILRQDPMKAKALLDKMQNPIELQQYSAAEFQAAVDMHVTKDMEASGEPSTDTIKLMEKANKIFSDLHKNMYGTKSMQVSVTGKVTHSQIAALIRQANSEGLAVDVTAEEITDTLREDNP